MMVLKLVERKLGLPHWVLHLFMLIMLTPVIMGCNVTCLVRLFTSDTKQRQGLQHKDIHFIFI